MRRKFSTPIESGKTAIFNLCKAYEIKSTLSESSIKIFFYSHSKKHKKPAIEPDSAALHLLKPRPLALSFQQNHVPHAVSHPTRKSDIICD